MKRHSIRTEKTDRTTKYLNTLKNHRLIASLIVLGIIITAVGNFTDALSKIWVFIKPEGNKPRIAAKVNAIILRKLVDGSNWQCEVHLGVANLENQVALINLNQLSIKMPSIDSRTVIIDVHKQIPVEASQNVSDTIAFQLPEMFKIDTDTTSAPLIMMEAVLTHSSGAVASKIAFDSQKSNWVMQYVWWPLPKDIYFRLHAAAKLNRLPKDWQKYDLSFQGQTYDCYYSPTNILLKIDVGETIRVRRIDEDMENQRIDLGKFTTFQHFSFVPPPPIEDRFIDLKKRGARLVYEQEKEDTIITGEFTVWYEQGYMYILYLKLK